MKQLQLLVVLALTIAFTLGGVGTNTTPAEASTPNAGAWVVAPKWWGWCPGGSRNKVAQVNVINYTAGRMAFSGWDGADKVHIAVVNGRRNQVQVSVRCTLTGWQSSGGWHYLSVDRTGRTFFVGLDGGTWRQ
jgi:hypothetical protein